MEHPEQTSNVTVKHMTGNGVLLKVTDEQGREFPLAATHDFLRTLRPGQKITIEASSDERWVAAKAERLEAADRAPGTDSPVGQGEEAASASIAGLSGASTVDEGATTRTTRPSSRK